MHAYLITGGSTTQRAKYLKDLTRTHTELIHITAEKSSITIKQIQDLVDSLKVTARLNRIIWIEEADMMTTPAQNALLKILEEPPANTTFYLTTHTPKSVLPTITSRTMPIALDQEILDLDPKVLTDLKSIMNLKAGDRLNAIVKRDRQESIAWLIKIEKGINTKIKDQSLSPRGLTLLARIANSTQSAHLQLLANCSVSLVTQNFYLTLPHTGSHN